VGRKLCNPGSNRTALKLISQFWQLQGVSTAGYTIKLWGRTLSVSVSHFDFSSFLQCSISVSMSGLLDSTVNILFSSDTPGANNKIAIRETEPYSAACPS
jgi:hypothetical protein